MPPSSRPSIRGARDPAVARRAFGQRRTRPARRARRRHQRPALAHAVRRGIPPSRARPRPQRRAARRGRPHAAGDAVPVPADRRLDAVRSGGRARCRVRGAHPGLFAVRKLRADETFERAAADMDTIARRLEKRYPDSNTDVAVAMTPYTEIVRDVGQHSRSARGGRIRIADGCANLADLMLAPGRAAATGDRRPARTRRRAAPDRPAAPDREPPDRRPRRRARHAACGTGWSRRLSPRGR